MKGHRFLEWQKTCTKFYCALFDKPQGFPGNLSGLSGFELGFSRDPGVCVGFLYVSVVFSGVCAGNPWA